MVDERKLLLQLQKRAKNSINAAIDIYTPYLSTVLYNIAGNSLPKEDIEEILSDVFITLWNNAEYIEPKKGTLRSYLAACARNFALKRLNKARDFADIDGLELPDDKDFAEDSIKSDFVWKSVMELGEPDNEIFVRYYKFGEKIKEISNATGLNVSTIKSKLSRGKRKLRILLNAEEWL